MAKSRLSLLKAFIADQRGDGAVGSVITMGLFVFLLMLTVWVSLTFYAQRVLAGAANDGAMVAAQYQATPGEGVAHAEQLIAAAGTSSLLENTNVAVGENTDIRVSIVASGKSVAPLFPVQLRAEGSASKELFRPQGGEGP